MNEDFHLSLDEVSDDGALEGLGNEVKAAMAKQRGSGLAAASAMVGGKVVTRIGEALQDLDLLKLFADAWATAKTVQDYGDPTKHAQGKTSYVTLGKHDMDFDVQAKVTVEIAGWHSDPIAFAVDLSAAIEAVELKIRKGHITTIGGGTCDFTIAIKHEDVVLLPKRSLRKQRLPGHHRFAAPGIDIRPAQFRTTQPG